MTDFKKEIIKSMPRDRRCLLFLHDLMELIEFHGILSEDDSNTVVDMCTHLKNIMSEGKKTK